MTVLVGGGKLEGGRGVEFGRMGLKWWWVEQGLGGGRAAECMCGAGTGVAEW